MNNIDFDRLRRDLIDYFESALFIGGFCMAIVDISKVQNASNDELIKIALNNKFDLKKYTIKKQTSDFI